MESSKIFSLSEDPLEELLLAYEAREDSVKLAIKTTVGEGQLHIDRGRLGLAVFGAQLGVDAFKSLLSYKEGTYTVLRVEPEECDPREHLELNAIIREKERSSTRLSASGQRPSLRVSSPLIRTSKPLPTGLAAAELRALAGVNGQLTVLQILRKSSDHPEAVLPALRELLRRGLVSEGVATSSNPTRPMAASSSSSPPPRTKPPSEGDGLAPNGQRNKSKKATGIWARSPQKRPLLDFTGYSSVPPPTLAAEHVSLPRSLQSAPNMELSAPLENERIIQDPHKESEHDETATVERRQRPQESSDAIAPMSEGHFFPRRIDTPTALSAAAVRANNDSDPPPAAYQLRESEIPVPSSRLDQATLEQLDELNNALQSSRRFRPLGDTDGEKARERELGSTPGSAPPSSLGLSLPAWEIPPPGSVPMPQDLPGEAPVEETTGLPRVGRYEVLARLKRGGMGSVYMCRLSGTAGFRRLFAMKVLHGHLAEQDQSLEAFFHEARVLGELHHPNIVGIADVGTPQEPYIVMDYVEGGSLAELYRATSEGRSPAHVIAIILDALNGLAYAHNALDENGEPLELVHCDVTPHNLLVGIDGSCRVTDFGIARTRKEGGSPEVLQGKPGYLAPERLRRAPADHRADVFSVGVALYAGLTGVEPFRGATHEESAQLILKGDVSPPSEVGFRPPPSFDWVCMKALAQHPDSRFSSADEMGAQLRRIAEREGILSSSAQVGKWVRSSLGPTLAARRAASMRGTGQTEPPPRASVFPPQVGKGEGGNQAPSDAPSALDITGPLDPPPSEGFEENTEIIQGGREGARHPMRKYMLLTALIAVLGIAVWGLLKPESLSSIFRLSDTTVDSKPSDNERLAPSPGEETADSADNRIEIDDDGNVVLPPIQPSGEK